MTDTIHFNLWCDDEACNGDCPMPAPKRQSRVHVLTVPRPHLHIDHAEGCFDLWCGSECVKVEELLEQFMREGYLLRWSSFDETVKEWNRSGAAYVHFDELKLFPVEYAKAIINKEIKTCAKCHKHLGGKVRKGEKSQGGQQLCWTCNRYYVFDGEQVVSYREYQKMAKVA